MCLFRSSLLHEPPINSAVTDRIEAGKVGRNQYKRLDLHTWLHLKEMFL